MRRTLLLLGTMALALLLASGLALAADGNCEPSGGEVVCTFAYTGAAQSWTVPDGVSQATFDVYGAQGGSEPRNSHAGGLGGEASATIAVTPGDTLGVNVGGAGSRGVAGGAGGAGGFNGGAPGGNGCFSGPGGGGGASDVRSAPFGLADRIIVAGGGGGAGGFAGGAGGYGGGSEGRAGNAGVNGGAPGGGGGGGGTSTEGGAGGVGQTARGDEAGDYGDIGIGGSGGADPICSTSNGFEFTDDGGGGGGGGYYGGGGGGGGFSGGGGGGGSGFGPSDVVFSDGGVRSGDGLVTITYTPPDSTAPTVSSINRAGSNPTNTTGSLSWTVTFSENVTGVDTGDFALANTGLGGTPTISDVSGSGANYTVTASTGTGAGTLGLNLSDNDSIKDGANNLLGGTGSGNGDFTGEVYTIDRTAPTVTPTAVKGVAPDFTGATGYAAGDWTNKDVQVTFACADTGGSGLTAASGNDVQTFTTETSGATATFSKTCEDNAGNTAAAATFGPIKIDKTAPSVTSSARPSSLKPPNHKLVPITASVTVSDSTGGSGSDGFTLLSVTSNQDDSGLGIDDVPNDIQGWTTGIADTVGKLRAERYGTDRIYTLTYQGKDKAGNTTNREATVRVPKGR